MDSGSHVQGHTGAAAPEALSSDSVRAQATRILSSRSFENAPVLRRLLQHLIEYSLLDKADQLKEYALGVDVFGRSVDFDPRTDTIVRVQARRLRLKLDEYYRGEGSADQIVIELPKGHYLLQFRAAEGSAAETRPRAGIRGVPRPVSFAVGTAVVMVTVLVLAITLPDRAKDLEPAAGGDSAAGGTAAAAPIDPPRIAVAVFDDRTGDSSLRSLGQMIAERLIQSLAAPGGVEVLPVPLKAPGTMADLEASAPAADTVIVAGAYYLQGDQLTIQSRVLDGGSGRVVRGLAPVAGSRGRPTEVLERVEQTVAGAMAIHFDEFFGGLDVVSHLPTLAAYREYRAGLEVFQSDYPRALSHLERALEKDPDFLLPLVIMCFIQGNLGLSQESASTLARMEGRWDRFSPAERLLTEYVRAVRERRRAAALRLLEDLERLAPDSFLVNFNIVQQSIQLNRLAGAVAAYSRGAFDERTLRNSIGTRRRILILQALHRLADYERELQESRLAQAFAPGVLAFLEAEARALVALGRVGEIDPLIDRILAVAPATTRPDSPGEVMGETVNELRAHGHRDESLRLASRTLDWYRKRVDVAPSLANREGLGWALYLARRWGEARAVFVELASAKPAELDYFGYIGEIDARAGDAAAARAISERLKTVGVTARDMAFATFQRAIIAAALGEHDEAIDLLRDSFNQGFPYGLALHNDPAFESLRQLPAYQQLVAPVN